ncbi:MAG: hypothetical protein R3E84_18150 [Pseudomonadales bacterium]
MKRVLIYFLAGIFVSGHGTATVHVDAERQRLELRQIATVNEPMFSVSTLPVCLDPNSNFVLVTKKRAGVIKAFDQARGRWIYEKWAKGDKPEFSTNQEFGGLLDARDSPIVTGTAGLHLSPTPGFGNVWGYNSCRSHIADW